MGGFDYSICCQLEEAVHKDKHLDICLKNLPVLSTKKASKYCPKDEKLYNKFGKRVPVDPEDFSRINCWFGVQPINDQLRSIQGDFAIALSLLNHVISYLSNYRCSS